ncbi:MAG: SDR family NAD(P)-dependent oxidoreductase [Anaerotruncus sp.]|nr:MAG: SDR family NAD(P)-dependent oxidoreductase [Anaerotruncus sp.]
MCLSRTPCDIKGVKSLPCDITKQEDIDAAFSQIEGVDLLINNAGFGVSGCAEFMEMSEIRSQFELNFFAHVAVTKAALPMLRKSKGRIIFTSSAAAIFSIPFQSFLFGNEIGNRIADLRARKRIKSLRNKRLRGAPGRC